MAGRVAEVAVLGAGNVSTAGSADLALANQLCRQMIFECGWSPTVGPFSVQVANSDELSGAFETQMGDMSPEMAAEGLMEMQKMLRVAEAKAYFGLVCNWELLNAMVDRVLDKDDYVLRRYGSLSLNTCLLVWLQAHLASWLQLQHGLSNHMLACAGALWQTHFPQHTRARLKSEIIGACHQTDKLTSHACRRDIEELFMEHRPKMFLDGSNAGFGFDDDFKLVWPESYDSIVQDGDAIKKGRRHAATPLAGPSTYWQGQSKIAINPVPVGMYTPEPHLELDMTVFKPEAFSGSAKFMAKASSGVHPFHAYEPRTPENSAAGQAGVDESSTRMHDRAKRRGE